MAWVKCCPFCCVRHSGKTHLCRGVSGHAAANYSGFTLVELLVAIVIMVLLAAMLLPGIARSKLNARRAVCLSNLKQMCVAAQVYVENNRDYYPVAYTNGVENGVSVAYAWDFTTVLENPVKVRPGILWEDYGADRIQQCPSFRGRANWMVETHTGYNYNTSYIGHGQFETIPWPAKSSAVSQPSWTVLFGDGEYGGGANKFMRAPWPNPGDASFKGRWAGTQGFRHGKLSNAGFCDGHVQSLRDRYTANADGPDNVAPETGFLSEDNSIYDLE